jgi:threonylcarbamoyladenosine tRNA methylthiotransferase MtaB
MKVHLRMLGCRLNQSEIDSMARQLEQQGHTIVQSAEEADHVIVNTCAVTHEAVKSGRKMIRDIHRRNDDAKITVTGCHAQIAPEEIQVLPGVARVMSNQEKGKIVSQITGQPTEPYDLEPLEREQSHFALRTRAFIKVQDGCDNACTFCITTVARGDGQSRSDDDIVREINVLVASGYQEAVLTGVHLGSYGHDQGNHDGLYHLVQRILRETYVPRLRLSSLEPWDLGEHFFDLWQDERLCPHLHLPLQSGCDSTLKRMRRNTNQAEFSRLVEVARAKIPHLRLTTDVIVGFPGETDEEFETSRAFIEAMDFAGMHIFRYSRRSGTPAARMRGHLINDVKKERSHILHTIAQEGEAHFANRYMGQTRPVLWEGVAGSSEDGFVNTGYTDNYLRVQAVHPRVLTNHITPAILGEFDKNVSQAQPILDVIAE